MIEAEITVGHTDQTRLMTAGRPRKGSPSGHTDDNDEEDRILIEFIDFV